MVSVGRDLIMGLINGIKAMAGVHTPYCLNNFEGEPICNALLAALTAPITTFFAADSKCCT
jgi:hypothetical protein